MVVKKHQVQMWLRFKVWYKDNLLYYNTIQRNILEKIQSVYQIELIDFLACTSFGSEYETKFFNNYFIDKIELSIKDFEPTIYNYLLK